LKIKAFSLLELIIVIFIITMILYFIIPKFQNIFYKSHLTQLKSNVAMIRNNISSLKNKEILYLKDLEIKDLDKATADKKNEKLFTKIIDFDII
jgi:type II secretory pathway pseudopilin PulG